MNSASPAGSSSGPAADNNLDGTATQADGADTAIEGIDLAAVTTWFAEHVPAIDAPLHFAQIAGGNSNLTFLVTGANHAKAVLRRPPTGMVLKGAHDMGREARVISALDNTPVPVPTVLGSCQNNDVTGAPFYVMDHVDGTVVDHRDVAERFAPEVRAHAAWSLVESLAAIHAVPVDEVGLSDFGRPEGYVTRQLEGWNRRYAKTSQVDAPAIDEAYRLLTAKMPPQQAATIAHGDYRLANTIIDNHGTIAAVLDWELSTLGDPLADVGLLMAYYDPDPAMIPPEVNPTSADGFPPVDDLVARYAELSPLDVSNVDYYVAFSYYRLGCIVAGVHARYLGGVMGREATETELTFFADQIRGCGRAAVDRLSAT